MRLGQRVRTVRPVTVWVLEEVTLSGEYVVEDVRPGLVRLLGLWVPTRFVEVCP